MREHIQMIQRRIKFLVQRVEEYNGDMDKRELAALVWILNEYMELKYGDGKDD